MPRCHFRSLLSYSLIATSTSISAVISLSLCLGSLTATSTSINDAISSSRFVGPGENHLWPLGYTGKCRPQKVVMAKNASVFTDIPAYRLCDPERFEKKSKDDQLRRRIRRYYGNQASLLRTYEVDRLHLTRLESAEVPEVKRACDKAAFARNLSFVCNMGLFAAKIYAAILSGSLSILGSMVDSFVDNTSIIVIWVVNWLIRTRDPYHYPRGRTRLEPLALIIISVIMGVASLQVIVKTAESIIAGTVDPQIRKKVEVANGTTEWIWDWPVISVMISTVLVKVILFVVCYFIGKGSPTVRVLAQDHRNDCLSNTVAVACGGLGSKYWNHIDSIGAILISVYIAASWLSTGCTQISMLSGRSARPYFISRIIKICLDHHHEILHVDAVAVYHYGTQFIVEVDIVMDGWMTLRHTHDISEPLQRKLERLPDVERAFVHVDFETKHFPHVEHKAV